jgi:chemotaxis protein MotB
MKPVGPLLIALVLVTAAGCVPQIRYDESLAYSATLQQRLEAALEQIDGQKATIAGLEAQLSTERGKVAALDELARGLEADNVELREKLTELSGLVADLSTRNKKERQAKADLEALVGSLQTDSVAARERVSAAQSRITDLEKEQERLAAEQAALTAEAERLRAEQAALAQRTAAYDDLVRELQGEIDAGEVTITELKGKLTVSLSNAILFDSGSTMVKQAGQDALQKVAAVLAQISDRGISVEGHTDDDTVKSGVAYKDNWGLSALRASTVVSLLVGWEVDPLNIAAVGLGEFHPVASNDDDEGKAANRRTEIVLVPRLEAVEDIDTSDLKIEDAPQ